MYSKKAFVNWFVFEDLKNKEMIVSWEKMWFLKKIKLISIKVILWWK